ncbi:sulfite oxidase [Salipaludibacillus sp. CF4.18]|uniref:sulfite oxidase n=1 Tax=Salipaludibacillus sp. CF4.18 TaxID=3373081 RepID=UPI003EE738CA
MTSIYRVDPFLTTRKLVPENQETPLSFIRTDRLPEHLFYKRNHFPYPMLTLSSLWLPVNGNVTNPAIISYNELMSLPAKTLTVLLECAGDKRRFFTPKVFGEQWEKGAISQGIWKGVSLKTLLLATGVKENSQEVVFEGYDFGKRTDSEEIDSFKRSLPLEKALHPDTMIAYEYNGSPLSFKHGYPFRLIVPQWYAMASVKWIKQITVIDQPFKGPFQKKDYMYYPEKESDINAFPVTTLRVNSSIQKPLDKDILNSGMIDIRGIAWTGEGKIRKVEVSVDGGEVWKPATFTSYSNDGYGWSGWKYEWIQENAGEYTIMSRATDTTDRTQPRSAFWNRKGYGYNAIDHIEVKLE